MKITKIPILEFKRNYPELILLFEKETKTKQTKTHAIWGNRLTKQFIYWLRQKLNPNNCCNICGKEFDSRYGLAQHIKWHNKEYSKNHSKKMEEMWNKKGYRKKMLKSQIEANNRPEVIEKHSKLAIKQWQNKEYRERMTGENNSNYKYNNIGYHQIHDRAHKADPNPIDGICAYCGNVADKTGITKLIHSNKDHSYRLPINPDEWQWIHVSCHNKYDMKNNRVKSGKILK